LGHHYVIYIELRTKSLKQLRPKLLTCGHVTHPGLLSSISYVSNFVQRNKKETHGLNICSIAAVTANELKLSYSIEQACSKRANATKSVGGTIDVGPWIITFIEIARDVSRLEDGKAVVVLHVCGVGGEAVRSGRR
jgi:hypothetical protein